MISMSIGFIVLILTILVWFPFAYAYAWNDNPEREKDYSSYIIYIGWTVAFIFILYGVI